MVGTTEIPCVETICELCDSVICCLPINHPQTIQRIADHAEQTHPESYRNPFGHPMPTHERAADTTIALDPPAAPEEPVAWGEPRSEGGVTVQWTRRIERTLLGATMSFCEGQVEEIHATREANAVVWHNTNVLWRGGDARPQDKTQRKVFGSIEDAKNWVEEVLASIARHENDPY